MRITKLNLMLCDGGKNETHPQSYPHYLHYALPVTLQFVITIHEPKFYEKRQKEEIISKAFRITVVTKCAGISNEM